MKDSWAGLGGCAGPFLAGMSSCLGAGGAQNLYSRLLIHCSGGG